MIAQRDRPRDNHVQTARLSSARFRLHPGRTRLTVNGAPTGRFKRIDDSSSVLGNELEAPIRRKHFSRLAVPLRFLQTGEIVSKIPGNELVLVLSTRMGRDKLDESNRD